MKLIRNRYLEDLNLLEALSLTIDEIDNLDRFPEFSSENNSEIMTSEQEQFISQSENINNESSISTAEENNVLDRILF